VKKRHFWPIFLLAFGKKGPSRGDNRLALIIPDWGSFVAIPEKKG